MKENSTLEVRYEDRSAVDGNGKNPGEKELINVGVKAGMPKKMCTNSTGNRIMCERKFGNVFIGKVLREQSEGVWLWKEEI